MLRRRRRLASTILLLCLFQLPLLSATTAIATLMMTPASDALLDALLLPAHSLSALTRISNYDVSRKSKSPSTREYDVSRNYDVSRRESEVDVSRNKIT